MPFAVGPGWRAAAAAAADTGAVLHHLSSLPPIVDVWSGLVWLGRRIQCSRGMDIVAVLPHALLADGHSLSEARFEAARLRIQCWQTPLLFPSFGNGTTLTVRQHCLADALSTFPGFENFLPS